MVLTTSFQLKQSTVFLDRDGVINHEPPKYAYKKKHLKLISGVPEAIKALKKEGFVILIVTNQSGIAKGYFKEEDMHNFNTLLKKELNKHDALIDKIYYCPHHPKGIVKEYSYSCDCRKPKTGMLIRAQKEFNIQFKDSFFIGDKKSDIDAGKSVGCKTILVKTGCGAKELKTKKIDCDFIAKDLKDATKYILKQTKL